MDECGGPFGMVGNLLDVQDLEVGIESGLFEIAKQR
jgi:hypothetical protein